MKNESLEKIVLKHTGEDLQKTDRINGKGFVNEIYLLSTNSSKYVLRVDPNESSIDRFQKEAWCMEAADVSGVLVPKNLGVGMEEAHPYTLLSYVDGVHGEEVSEENKSLIWSKLGQYARKIHSIPTKGFGEKMTAPGNFDGSWSNYLEYNISSLNEDDRLLALRIITKDQSKILKDIFLQLKNAEFNFGLIHNDLSLKNTILGSDSNVYLLDWGSAGVDIIPHVDLAEILRSSLTENSEEFALFLKNYGMGKEEFEKMRPDISRLELLGFTDKVRWALDRKPELIKEKAKELKEALIRYNNSQ